MLFLVKLFPEITIKSRPVRKRLVRLLRKNLKMVLKQIDAGVVITGEWDCLEIETSSLDEAQQRRLVESIANTPGISLFLEVDRYELPDMEGILALADRYYGARLPGHSFAVRCKRMGKQEFKSVDVERVIGSGLNLKYESASVKLKNPDVTVAMEIREDQLYMVKQHHAGLGGYPLGGHRAIQKHISGGFDSAVSSFHAIKRGLLTHYCFFNLGGKAHELAVKEVALYLWMKYHASHRVKFVSVPFEGVVEEILSQVDDSQMGVVLKRMMLRAANGVAERLNVKALVTGESVSQVSSQTLANLNVIDDVSELLVLRPLCTTDKQTIIDTARSIGTEEFSKHIPEYCAVISKNPTTKAKPQRIADEEARFDFSKLDAAIASARFQLITEVVEDLGSGPTEVKVVAAPDDGQVVIDIRHPSEIELSPMPDLADAPEVLEIPFYQLRARFEHLNPDTQYLLYCDQGMMSRLHAAHLGDEGFANVAVLDLRVKPEASVSAAR